MTQLEKEMFDAILKTERYDDECEAMICAKIARKWIIKAVKDSSETHMQGFLQDWFIENDKEYI